ncbi:hypothetical protein J6590_039845 [Homalodisca vitripennis]|nr:hypothetical protein J6590_039845 [Homalodisca vitripennis]
MAVGIKRCLCRIMQILEGICYNLLRGYSKAQYWALVSLLFTLFLKNNTCYERKLEDLTDYRLGVVRKRGGGEFPTSIYKENPILNLFVSQSRASYATIRCEVLFCPLN